MPMLNSDIITKAKIAREIKSTYYIVFNNLNELEKYNIVIFEKYSIKPKNKNKYFYNVKLTDLGVEIGKNLNKVWNFIEIFFKKVPVCIKIINYLYLKHIENEVNDNAKQDKRK